MDKPFFSVAKGFRKRTVVTAKLSAKLGFGVAKSVIKNKVRAAFPEKITDLNGQSTEVILKDKKKQEQLTQEAIDMGLELFQEMDQLKGLVMKFGQMASYMATQLPPEAQRIIAKLQSEASALPYVEVKPILIQELGRPVEDVFDKFDGEAIAAASIGQVHKAQYQGQQVAVKIQYPGIKEGVASDLKLLQRGASMSSMVSSLMGISIDSKELYQELHDRIIEECDYNREAGNQQFAKSCWPGDDHIYIPAVYPSLSSEKLLVSEYMEGKGYYDFKETASQEDKNKAAETLFRMMYESIFKYGFFNGDPHPGNYLFGENGQVTFLDFGCVRYFESVFLNSWRGLARSVLNQDQDRFRHFTQEMGFVGNEKKFDWGFHWELYNFVFEPIMIGGLFTYTEEYQKRGDALFIFENKNRAAMNIPKPLLLASRLEWGLKTILVDLKATGDFGKLFRAALA